MVLPLGAEQGWEAGDARSLPRGGGGDRDQGARAASVSARRGDRSAARPSPSPCTMPPARERGLRDSCARRACARRRSGTASPHTTKRTPPEPAERVTFYVGQTIEQAGHGRRRNRNGEQAITTVGSVHRAACAAVRLRAGSHQERRGTDSTTHWLHSCRSDAELRRARLPVRGLHAALRPRRRLLCAEPVGRMRSRADCVRRAYLCRGVTGWRRRSGRTNRRSPGAWRS